MTAETDIAAIDDGGANTALEVRTALTSVLARAWGDPVVPAGTAGDIEWDGTDSAGMSEVTVSGSQTIIEQNGLLSVSFEGQSASDFNCLLSAQSFSIGDEWAIPVRVFARPHATSGVSLRAGIVFTDGVLGSSNCVAFYMQTTALVAAIFIFVGSHGTLTDGTDTTPGAVTSEIPVQNFPWVWMKLTYAAANSWQISVSPDGLSFTTMGESTFEKIMTPTHVGPMWHNDTAIGDAIATYGPLRKLA